MCSFGIGSSTLPRTTTRAIETDAGAGAAGRSDKVAAATSSTSLYDNVTGSQPANQAPPKRNYFIKKYWYFLLSSGKNIIAQ